jgi:hypothetical protein
MTDQKPLQFLIFNEGGGTNGVKVSEHPQRDSNPCRLERVDITLGEVRRKY